MDVHLFVFIDTLFICIYGEDEREKERRKFIGVIDQIKAEFNPKCGHIDMYLYMLES